KCRRAAPRRPRRRRARRASAPRTTHPPGSRRQRSPTTRRILGSTMRQPTDVRPVGALVSLRLADELDPNGLLVGAELLRSAEQLAHRLPPLLAVLARKLVHVHPDEAVGELRVEPAPEPERVFHRLVAVVEPDLDRVAQHV